MNFQEVFDNPEIWAIRRQLFPYEQFALAIVAIRGEFQLTQGELAERIGTTQSAVSRAESGSHAVSSAFLKRIGDAFDRDIVLDWRPRE